jgi:hypothetical protein
MAKRKKAASRFLFDPSTQTSPNHNSLAVHVGAVEAHVEHVVSTAANGSEQGVDTTDVSVGIPQARVVHGRLAAHAQRAVQ